MGHIPEGNSSRSVSMGLFHASSSWGRFSSSLEIKKLNFVSEREKSFKCQKKRKKKKIMTENRKVLLNLGCQLLPWSLASGGLASSLLCTCHLLKCVAIHYQTQFLQILHQKKFLFIILFCFCLVHFE